jgi:SecY interacting protein Syd
MEVKLAMERYFDKLQSIYSKKSPPYPQTPYNEDVDDFIYVGEPDEYEWISWKPVVKSEKHDLAELSNRLNVEIHPSVKEYYNSFWFCSLGGKIGEFRIQLDEVLPNVELETFIDNLIGYKAAHNGLIENIPVGVETNQSLLVVVDNKTGEVKLEDYEIGAFTVLADSLSALILKLADSL